MEFEPITNIIFLLSVVRCTRAGADGRGSMRTVGGRDALPKEFPYVVRMEMIITIAIIGTKHIPMCTASVLTQTATLTAAHCCDYQSLRDADRLQFTIFIRYGSAAGRPDRDDSYSEVLSYDFLPSLRPLYHPAAMNDLAILTTQPIHLSKYARLSSIDNHLLFGQRVLILGYGISNCSKGKMKDTLNLKMPLQVIDGMWSKCDYPGMKTYPLECAVSLCGRYSAACPGDSGGPVLHASGLVGVNSMSFKKENCQMRTDSIRNHVIEFFIPISTNIDWIADKIKATAKF